MSSRPVTMATDRSLGGHALLPADKGISPLPPPVVFLLWKVYFCGMCFKSYGIFFRQGSLAFKNVSTLI